MNTKSDKIQIIVCVIVIMIFISHTNARQLRTHGNFTAFLCFWIFLMKRWINDKFSNLGIQYHQSDLLSKHLEILARIIKNKLEIRNQQNRARIIRQRVRKGNKNKSRKIKLLIYQSIFRLWKRGFFEYCKKPPKFFEKYFESVIKLVWIRTKRKQWNKWSKQTHIQWK